MVLVIAVKTDLNYWVLLNYNEGFKYWTNNKLFC